MKWPRRQRQPRHAIRAEGDRLADGDVVPIAGYPRWAELVTKEYPKVPLVPPLYPER